MVNIKDIARMTGFSIMTVSRALNQPQLVKPETLRTIMEAMQSSGYVQNRVARSLVTGFAYNICLYIPSTLNARDSFVAQTVSAIGERLGALGYSLTFRRNLSLDDNFDGIIAAGLHIDEEASFAEIAKVKPTVLYGNSEHFCNWVDVDNYRGIYNMTKLIIERGHKNLAYIGLDHNSHFVLQRKNGFLDAVRDSGLQVNPDFVLSAKNSESDGFEACEQLLQRGKPSAIVCATDLLAVGVVHLLKRKRISIPSDIAVSGFDGFGVENTVFPKLATVRQPLYEVGVKIADTVVDIIKGVRLSKGIYIEPTIDVGETI